MTAPIPRQDPRAAVFAPEAPAQITSVASAPISLSFLYRFSDLPLLARTAAAVIALEAPAQITSFASVPISLSFLYRFSDLPLLARAAAAFPPEAPAQAQRHTIVNNNIRAQTYTIGSFNDQDG